MSQYDQAINASAPGPSARGIYRLGFWISILIAIAALAAMFVAATTAPPRSGPFCWMDECITYPYTDAAEFVPIDYFWMYPAALIGPLFVILIACIHHFTTSEKKAFTRIALGFAIISAAALFINYYVQLTTVQTSLLQGELDGLILISQYNPHGVFIALEDIGYLTMGIALVFAAAAFCNCTKLGKTIRITFLTTSTLVIGSFVALTLIYGHDLQYRYEVATIVINWISLGLSGTLLAVFFNRAKRQGISSLFKTRAI